VDGGVHDHFAHNPSFAIGRNDEAINPQSAGWVHITIYKSACIYIKWGMYYVLLFRWKWFEPPLFLLMRAGNVARICLITRAAAPRRHTPFMPRPTFLFENIAIGPRKTMANVEILLFVMKGVQMLCFKEGKHGYYCHVLCCKFYCKQSSMKFKGLKKIPPLFYSENLNFI
jgi:hypothetical protein